MKQVHRKLKRVVIKEELVVLTGSGLSASDFYLQVQSIQPPFDPNSRRQPRSPRLSRDPVRHGPATAGATRVR